MQEISAAKNSCLSINFPNVRNTFTIYPILGQYSLFEWTQPEHINSNSLNSWYLFPQIIDFNHKLYWPVGTWTNPIFHFQFFCDTLNNTIYQNDLHNA